MKLKKYAVKKSQRVLLHKNLYFANQVKAVGGALSKDLNNCQKTEQHSNTLGSNNAIHLKDCKIFPQPL